MTEQTTAEDIAMRQRWMGALAKADGGDLDALWTLAMNGAEPRHTPLRGPEVGMVMTQGRAGGTGDAFNLGEMTVTRCAVRLEETGAIGQSWIAGRNKRHAMQAALCDGLLQTPETHDLVWREIILPLESGHETRRRAQARKAAATRVEFFTMVRGED